MVREKAGHSRTVFLWTRHRSGLLSLFFLPWKQFVKPENFPLWIKLRLLSRKVQNGVDWPRQSFFLIIFYWLCYYSYPHFPPFVPLLQCPPLYQAIPHNCSCPWFTCISSLSTPLPILSFTSPWLFCYCLFILLNHLTSSPIPPHPSTIWQPSKRSPYPWFCLSSSWLLSLFFRFQLFIDMRVLSFYCS